MSKERKGKETMFFGMSKLNAPVSLEYSVEQLCGMVSIPMKQSYIMGELDLMLCCVCEVGSQSILL